MKLTVIGCGRWGTFLAWYLDRLGHAVTLYGRESSTRMQRLIETRSNDLLTLPESVCLTMSLAEAATPETIIISIASQNLQALMDQLAEENLRDKTIVLCMKGLEAETGRRLSEIVRSTLDASNRVAVWLGPGHVQEFVLGVPNCMVIDSEEPALKESLAEAFAGDLIRFYYGEDLLGNEIGAAAKNVIGIAAGMLDGLSLCTLKGALMSRGTREIARLIAAMGGNAFSAYGLCHLGDYEATVFSQHSQNRRFGEAFVRGEPYDKLAEGYYTTRALVALGANYGVELPICQAVYAILFEGRDPRAALDALFKRERKCELK